MAIRYDKKLNEEINRTLRNFNQKVRRLEKEERKLLPSKISKKELKSSVYTRNELIRNLKELQIFSKRGAEDIITTKGGVVTTKYEISKLKKRISRAKNRISREITFMEKSKPKIFGKEQSRTFAQMGDTFYLNLLAKKEYLSKNINKLTAKEYETYKNLVDRINENYDYRDNKFKQSYIKMLTELAYYIDYDNFKLNEMIDILNRLKPHDFYKMYKEDKGIRAILEYYLAVLKTSPNFDIDKVRDDLISIYDLIYDRLKDISMSY